MAIVPKNEYRVARNEPRIYTFVRGSELELVIPFDDEVSNLEVTVAMNGLSDNCMVLTRYNLSATTQSIPGTITNKFKSHMKGILSIRNKATNETSNIKVLINEQV